MPLKKEVFPVNAVGLGLQTISLEPVIALVAYRENLPQNMACQNVHPVQVGVRAHSSRLCLQQFASLARRGQKQVMTIAYHAPQARLQT